MSRFSVCLTCDFIFLDHESRNHDYEEDTPSEPQENTPLLRHYPLRRRSTMTTIFVSIMLAILVFGIVVSLFLLMEQGSTYIYINMTHDASLNFQHDFPVDSPLLPSPRTLTSGVNATNLRSQSK